MKITFGRIFKICGKVILWFVGIWIALFGILELVLSPSVMTGLVNKYANEYIDGELKFSRASISMFKRFPNVVLNLEDFSITYPADRFDLLEKEGAQSHLVHKGCGAEADTLASFRRFSASLNVPALLTGAIHVPHVRLDKPRIFAHSYQDGSANWNIFKLGEPQSDTLEVVADEPDTTVTESGPLKLAIGKIWMSGRPVIVYTDSRDTIFASISMKRFELRGNIRHKRSYAGKVGMTLDSMFVAGRLGLDTLALGLDRLYLHDGNRSVIVDAAAKTFMATNGYGRMMIPIKLNGDIQFPKEEEGQVLTKDFIIDIASIPIIADAVIDFGDEGFKADGDIRIERCNLKPVIDRYAVKFIPQVSQYSTDIFLGMDLGFDVSSDDRMLINANLKKLTADAAGLGLSLNLKADDVTGNDPKISMDGKFRATLDSLTALLPDSLAIEARGMMKAHIKGNARLSQLNLYNFSNADLSGELTADSLIIDMPKDTISASIDSLKIILGPEERTIGKDLKKVLHLMGITGTIAKADISYKESIKLHTENFLISAKNSMDSEIEMDSLRLHPFSGRLSAKKLSLTDSEGTSLRLNNSSNSFRIMPKRGQAGTPTLSLTSRNEKIFLRSQYNRAALSNANMQARAVMNTIERRQKAKAFIDSLSRVYPDIPRDSLFAHMMKSAGSRKIQMPGWMQEEDFRKHDIDISLDKTLAKYFREWDLSGGMSVEKGMVMTPYFPLRNSLGGFDLKFTNNDISINKLDLKAGESNLSATGRLSGLKRALLGRKGALKLDVAINSDGVNADQLLSAYSSGMNFNPETFKGNSENISDEEFMEQVIIDTTGTTVTPSLIVVPGNIVAEIKLNASDLKYSDLHVNSMTADLIMKERCVQITDTKALTNMGDISMEGFYSTRTKDDLKAGFSLNFKDITAEKVINLMPAVDTIMPLLKSFGGLLNCELAATAQLDTNMNLIMPSINGIMRIGGENLTISDNEMFNKLAKVLMFRNKKKGQIDKMTVEGVIKDSRLEIFPFILEMDRYMLGLSGIQNMDMSYRYHASLIKSPFIIKLGMDVYGQDFDNMKFKIGKAKYKSKNVPVFSTVIDDTKINLVESIRNIYDKGVDAVMNESQRMKAIEEHRKKIGYVQAVDQKLEELSADEQTKLEAEQNAAESETESATETTNETNQKNE